MTDNNRYQIPWYKNADIPLLLFIIGVANVKLYIKVVAVVLYFIYLLYRKYPSQKTTGLVKFYLLMPVIGTIGAVWHGSFYEDSYWFSFAMSCILWLLAAATAGLLRQSIGTLSKEAVVATLKLFFLLNSLASALELIIMIIESGQLVPYWYWEPTEYYGSSTGDHIKGITGNISITNAGINAIGILYFIYHRHIKTAIFCTIILLLCTSNLTLIFLMLTLLAMLLFVKEKLTKQYIFYILLTIGIVYPFLSLNNLKYVQHVYSTNITDSDKEIEKKKQTTTKPYNTDYLDYEKYPLEDKQATQKESHYKLTLNDTALISYKDDLKYINAEQRLKSTSNSNLKLEPAKLQKTISDWYGTEYEKTPLTNYNSFIKLYSMKQIWWYWKSAKKNLVFGSGMGNFSSKQAIKSTGLGWQGTYPRKYIYISDDFLQYHLYTLMYVFSLPIAEHSVINMPNSVYNQIAGEYGLLGVLTFIILYVGFILKYIKRLKAGWYLCIFFFPFLAFDYWFEMLSVTVFFELIILLEFFGKTDDNS